MAKASPIVRSFNAGEFSELLAGRTDVDRYPASLRSMVNFIAAPQGPAVCRSGTAFMVPVSDESEHSALVPFIFSNEQSKLLEVAADRIRFIDEDGIQIYAAVSATVTSSAGAAIEATVAGLDAEVGDQVVINGFPSNFNLNGEVADVTAKAGDDYTLSMSIGAGLTVEDCTLAKVYKVDCTYTEAERQSLRFVQSVDVIYLFCGTSRPKKLSRYGDYDWRIEDVQFVDGPYQPTNATPTRLTPSSTGNAVPVMASNTAPSGDCSGSSNRPTVSGSASSSANFLGRSLYYSLPASQYYYAFDENDDTYWAANAQQTGNIAYHTDTAFVLDGYSIYAAKDNQDTSYLAKDYAPSSFRLEAKNTGDPNWVILDAQEDYVLYENSKSIFIPVENETSYDNYRLVVSTLFRNGQIEPRVRRLVLRSTESTAITLTADSAVGINNDNGFQSTDVGRLIRVKGNDGSWRSLEIDTVNSTTEVVTTLLGEPLPNLDPIREWRIGYWSDTTGWPSVGDFFEDRLWLAGVREFPDMFAGSSVGGYEDFSPTDPFGVVQDDNGWAGRLNSRRLSGIRWLSSDSRGLIVGTGSEEYGVSAPNQEALTARNIKARVSTRRGSAEVEPVRIDNQILYIQRSGRTVREFAFVFEADGYKSPSMSQLASHLGALPFVEMDYAAEPHSIIWIRRFDGSLVGLTYNRDENVVGWHRHDLSGGGVESLAVLPQKDQLQDALWAVVTREVNGQDRRYIERLTRFWDFDTTLDDAWFVDSGLRYVGDPIQEVYGLQHLEGQEVYGLADTRPVGPFTVTGGKIDLPYEASNIIIGLGYDSEAETSRLENGAADGTAQGKTKRINNFTAYLWASAGGEVGVWNEEQNAAIYEPMEYPGDFSQIEDVSLFTGPIGPVTTSPGYDNRGSMFFRRPKSSPLPFNLVALMPQLNTQDR